MKVHRELTLQSKLIAVVIILVLFQIGIMGMVSTYLVDDILEDQLGKRVLSVSQTIARMPDVARLLRQRDPNGELQRIAESVRVATGAKFVVIGDEQGIRFSHPDPAKIGRPMVGGDNEKALKEGITYTSRAVGTMGSSLRGKVPVIDDRARIVGVVSVGYLEDSIQQMLASRKAALFATYTALLIVGIAFAVGLAWNFRRAIFGLEPHQIARMFHERTAILGSIREGVVAINSSGNITMLNPAAKRALGLSADTDYLNQPVADVVPGSGLPGVLRSGKSELDTEHRIGEKEIVVNRVPIWHDQRVVGVVSSFREKDEIDTLARELSRVQDYSEMLRQQTHEYSNKLHTISGLIQLEAYDKAIELIGRETSGYQDLLQFLVGAVPDPLVAGCILGKYSRAQELNIQLNIDRDSSFSDVPDWVSREKIVSILGNLLDNAFQAVALQGHRKRVVNLSLTDLGNDLVFEVEDSGSGIADEVNGRIFEKGVTTSDTPGKGMGLYLVEDMLHSLGGHITVDESALGGVVFTVYIAKSEQRYA